MCTDDLHFIRQKKERRAPGKKDLVTVGMSECLTGSIAAMNVIKFNNQFIIVLLTFSVD